MLWAGALAQHPWNPTGSSRAQTPEVTLVQVWWHHGQSEGGICCAYTRSCGICPVPWELQPCHRQFQAGR